MHTSPLFSWRPQINVLQSSVHTSPIVVKQASSMSFKIQAEALFTKTCGLNANILYSLKCGPCDSSKGQVKVARLWWTLVYVTSIGALAVHHWLHLWLVASQDAFASLRSGMKGERSRHVLHRTAAA